MPPLRRRPADLLGQLASGAGERRFAGDVEPSGRDLEQVGNADGLAGLADEPDVQVVVGDDPDRAGVRDDLALDDRAVLVPEAVDADGPDHPFVPDLAAEPLEPAHAVPSRVPHRAAPGRSVATTAPAARAAAKKAGSSSSVRPIVLAGRPVAA